MGASLVGASVLFCLFLQNMISLFEGHFLFKSPDSVQIVSPYIGLTVIWVVHSI